MPLDISLGQLYINRYKTYNYNGKLFIKLNQILLLMDIVNEAIDLFKKKYGKTPKELGFPVIGIYKKQHAFLYADTEETIRAYKTHQNIIRWMMTWFMWPLPIALLIWFIALAEENVWHPLCIASYIFYGVWGILLVVLSIKVRKAGKLIKLGENVTFLNY